MRVPVLGTETLGNAVTLRNVAIGAGVVFLAPVAVSLIGIVMRPIAKAAIKSGLMVYDKGREMAAETKESVENLTAEARAEMAEHREVKVAEQRKQRVQPAPRRSHATVKTEILRYQKLGLEIRPQEGD